MQPTLTDHVNIGPDSPKVHSYRPVGSSGTPALGVLHYIIQEPDHQMTCKSINNWGMLYIASLKVFYFDKISLLLDMVTSALVYLLAELWHDPT